MPRWMQFILALALGIAGGLLYGWVISPVEYVDTSPDTLRLDYRTDYVLMVAEAYALDGNLDQAGRQLAALGSQRPVDIAGQALTYARENNYPFSDQDMLQRLSLDLVAWQPPNEGTLP